MYHSPLPSTSGTLLLPQIPFTSLPPSTSGTFLLPHNPAPGYLISFYLRYSSQPSSSLTSYTLVLATFLLLCITFFRHSIFLNIVLSFGSWITSLSHSLYHSSTSHFLSLYRSHSLSFDSKIRGRSCLLCSCYFFRLTELRMANTANCYTTLRENKLY